MDDLIKETKDNLLKSTEYQGKELTSYFPFMMRYIKDSYSRSIGMTKGILKRSDEGKALIEIDGFDYLADDKRDSKKKLNNSLTDHYGKEIYISYYPTTSIKAKNTADYNPKMPLKIKIRSLRNDLPLDNHAEIIAKVYSVQEDHLVFHFTIHIKDKKDKQYFTNVFYESGQIDKNKLKGQFVKVEAFLKDGRLYLKNLTRLTKSYKSKKVEVI